MSSPAPSRASAWTRERWRGVVQGAVIGLVGAATVAAVALGGGNPVVAAAPVLVVTAAYLLWRMPLRYSAAALLLLALVADSSIDGDQGLFLTPLSVVGDLLKDNVDRALGIPGVRLSGLEVAVLLLLLVAVVRRVRGSEIDLWGRVRTCPLLRDLILVYLGVIVFAVVNGLVQGGTFQLWQVRVLLQIAFLFFFFQLAFHPPRDHALLWRVVLAGALYKAVLSCWIYMTVLRPDGSRVTYTTNHGDSILFDGAILLLLAHAAERPDRRRVMRAVTLVPILLLGMIANNRRLAWVGLGFGLVVLYALTSWRPWKRRLVRTLIVVAPVVAIYIGVGWNHTGSSLFAPVRTFRTLADGKSDASTLWREVENWNIIMSMRAHPFIGTGLGREYVEHMANDDISSIYPEFKFWPHNSVLGMVLFFGAFGFVALWAINMGVVYLAIRSYQRSTSPEDRTAAIWAVCMVVLCIVQAYGDIGAPLIQYRLFMGLALASAGKLATLTGAWSGPAVARARVPIGWFTRRRPKLPVT